MALNPDPIPARTGIRSGGIAVRRRDTGAETLGCGRDLDQVWAHADRPADSHERDCPYCQAARASYADLKAATRRVREADQQDPDLILSDHLVTRILSLARADARRGTTIPLRPAGVRDRKPELTITEQAVATVVRRVSDTYPGIEARRCRIRLEPDLAPSSDGPDHAVSVRIELTAATAPHLAIGEQTSALREDIRATVAQTIGIVAARVDILVDDLLDEGESGVSRRPA